MKRREFLQALGLGAAGAIVGTGSISQAAEMEQEVDPDLADFVDLVRDLYNHSNRPGWIVVPESVYAMLESELIPTMRYQDAAIAQRGHMNLLILGIPVIPLHGRNQR